MSNDKSTAFGSWTLNEIVQGRLFRVPDYQRGYAWSKRQLEEFWEDVNAVVKSGNRHYTGAITVEKRATSSHAASRDEYEVVDGQQRMTTAAILLSVLKNDDNPFVVDENGIKQFVFSYGEDNEDRPFLEQLLTGKEIGEVTNNHQRNLKLAKDFFLSKVSEIDASQKVAVFDTVMERLAFDFRVLEKDFDAGVVFETMNNRGKPLTLLEKLKNRLMYLTNRIASDERNDGGEGVGVSDDLDSIDDAAIDLRKTVVETWGEIYQMLGRNPKRVPLDEDEFLAAHLSLYRNPKESTYSPAVAESRLFKMFCIFPERYPLSESVDENDVPTFPLRFSQRVI